MTGKVDRLYRQFVTRIAEDDKEDPQQLVNVLHGAHGDEAAREVLGLLERGFDGP